MCKLVDGALYAYVCVCVCVCLSESVSLRVCVCAHINMSTLHLYHKGFAVNCWHVGSIFFFFYIFFSSSQMVSYIQMFCMGLWGHNNISSGGKPLCRAAWPRRREPIPPLVFQQNVLHSSSRASIISASHLHPLCLLGCGCA